MLDALTHDQLRVFVAVAEAGSFRGGARTLRRAQSAVSHAVASLEAQLGLTLFDRAGYRPELTEDGRVVLAEAREVLARVGALKARARSLRTGVEASLAIAVDPYLPFAPVAAALAAVHKAHPDVPVRVRVAPLGGPVQSVSEGSCSLGLIVSEDVRSPGIRMTAMGDVTLQAVAAPWHPLATDAEANPADHLGIVVTDPSGLTGDVVFGTVGSKAWLVDDLVTKRVLIVEGIGWGSMPTHSIEADVSAGRLVAIAPVGLPKYGRTTLPTYLVQRVDATTGPVADAFVRALFERNAEIG